MGISRQQSLFDTFDLLANPVSRGALAGIESMAGATQPSDRGAVFTRREVAEQILDLVEYTADKPLYECRILEPAFGRGCFLFPIVERLLTAWEMFGDRSVPIEDALCDAVRAIEIHRDSFAETASTLTGLLQSRGMTEEQSTKLVKCWLVAGDFLLMPMDSRFTHVVGNPPYLRIESVPAPLMAEYRRRYHTMFDRADIYVPFIERGLDLLIDGGRLGYICSDRWLKNRYGGPLRKLISESFHLRTYIDMVGADAFDDDVSAYTGIFVIAREKTGPTLVTKGPIPAGRANGGACASFKRIPAEGDGAAIPPPSLRMNLQAAGKDPWLVEGDGPSALLKNLESRFPTIEEVGCRVGIGVATGADHAFIHDFNELDVEPDRKLPLVTRDDLVCGTVQWGGLGVINPFRDDGGLVNLDDYPRLNAWLEARRGQIAGRHCARKNPSKWYRTIDRIWPDLVGTPKLLIPDISESCGVAYEDGQYYPHHNLYYIRSGEWDLRALQAILLSGVSHLFLDAYSLKVRGGYLRCQAQYLRRIRIPEWNRTPDAVRIRLREAAESNDIAACDIATFDAYELSCHERDVISAMRGAKDGRKG